MKDYVASPVLELSEEESAGSSLVNTDRSGKHDDIIDRIFKRKELTRYTFVKSIIS
jgi:hypothetical protein